MISAYRGSLIVGQHRANSTRDRLLNLERVGPEIPIAVILKRPGGGGTVTGPWGNLVFAIRVVRYCLNKLIGLSKLDDYQLLRLIFYRPKTIRAGDL